ncbi:hypothetical protein RaK2_00391 [Klebsiella phage vB_KleM_RaK2]|uniref:Uncharacterized protein n=1 Tax=Klebsiella phage vB_KleM_RaK2 TaxID=1147094 RepID=H6X4J8_9CAUD|nr:hypothetical protein F403_gp144 [Klebsiella phage vB_KleM_RaK2]AFA44664.1 hypothetical protein RaK2_00391 [Klebsiella phage vB_KleM_RaK2]
MKNELRGLLSTQTFLKRISTEEIDFIRKELLNQLFDSAIKNFANDLTVIHKDKIVSIKILVCNTNTNTFEYIKSDFVINEFSCSLFNATCLVDSIEGYIRITRVHCKFIVDG